jgi:hypothetical protein
MITLINSTKNIFLESIPTVFLYNYFLHAFSVSLIFSQMLQCPDAIYTAIFTAIVLNPTLNSLYHSLPLIDVCFYLNIRYTIKTAFTPVFLLRTNEEITSYFSQ